MNPNERPLLGNFYILAVLQAARAHQLGLSLDAAKSWGLSRAIFHEAAKLGYLSRGGRKPPEAFDRLVRGRFPNWEVVWKEAMQLMNDASPYILTSGAQFYRELYRRWRPVLAQAWSRGEPALQAPDHRAAAA